MHFLPLGNWVELFLNLALMSNQSVKFPGKALFHVFKMAEQSERSSENVKDAPVGISSPKRALIMAVSTLLGIVSVEIPSF